MVGRVLGVWMHALAVIVLITACGCTSKEPESEMMGNITVYTAMLPEQVKTYLEIFQKEYPRIKVKSVILITGKLTERLFAERDQPQADVIWGLSVTNLVPMEWYDMLAPYAPTGLKDV